ncbi:MAG: hypothetical protein ACE5OZ_13105 [Candidatus Heimdallarchaeota archaeon]
MRTLGQEVIEAKQLTKRALLSISKTVIDGKVGIVLESDCAEIEKAVTTLLDANFHLPYISYFLNWALPKTEMPQLWKRKLTDCLRDLCVVINGYQMIQTPLELYHHTETSINKQLESVQQLRGEIQRAITQILTGVSNQEEAHYQINSLKKRIAETNVRESFTQDETETYLDFEHALVSQEEPERKLLEIYLKRSYDQTTPKFLWREENFVGYERHKAKDPIYYRSVSWKGDSSQFPTLFWEDHLLLWDLTTSLIGPLEIRIKRLLTTLVWIEGLPTIGKQPEMQMEESLSQQEEVWKK